MFARVMWWLAPPAVLAVALGVWQLLSLRMQSLYFPPLTEIGAAIRDTWFSTDILDDAFSSFGRALLGFALAVLLGVLLGMAVGLSPLVSLLAKAQLEFLRAIPPVLMIPPALLILGTGMTMKVGVIVLSSIWPIMLATIDGVRATEPLRRDTAAVFSLPYRALVRWTILPGAIPRIWSGVRAAVPVVLVVMVASDYYASSNGVGNMIAQAGNSFLFADMWATVVLLGLFGVVVNLAVIRVGRWLERKFGEFGEQTA